MSPGCFWKCSPQHSQGRLMDIVQLSQQAGIVQPLQGKGYLDNEREMRIFLPHPALGRMQASVQLYREVELDLVRPGSVEGTSAELSGLVC